MSEEKLKPSKVLAASLCWEDGCASDTCNKAKRCINGGEFYTTYRVRAEAHLRALEEAGFCIDRRTTERQP